MKIIDKEIFYTEEDLNGFSFVEVTKEEKEQVLQGILAKNYSHIKICMLLLIPSIVLKLFVSNFEVVYFTYLYDTIIIFLLFCFLYIISLEKKDYRKGIIHKHKVLIAEKKKMETIANSLSNGRSKYYPVIGKDAVTGYESICYLSQKDYSNCSEGQMVECWKIVVSETKEKLLIRE